MDVFDSNIWVFGISEAAPRPTQLVEEAENGDREVAVNAYIYEEVLEAFDRSTHVPQEKVDQTKTNFATRIAKAVTIHEPSQEEVQYIDVDATREAPIVQLLGYLLNIQPKDVPVFVLAYRWKHRNPTIYTNDGEFAKLNPSNFGLPEITIQHVPY